MTLDTLLERGLLPDPVVRFGIRRLLRRRLDDEDHGDVELNQQAHMGWVGELRRSPIAIETNAANDQHYEVPAALYENVLGPRLKYSSGLWSEGVTDLARAEEAMLDLTTRRGQLEDGMDVLDLGCGWGSLTLWIAERFPRCRILSVSNSATQREFILARAAERGLSNVDVVTRDVNRFETERRFDRVFSVEMFEHMRNYEQLLARIGEWLTPEGCLFVHLFCHRRVPYAYQTQGADNWMGRHFFSGGIMPSDDLLLRCRSPLVVRAQWRWPGTHYQRTADAWLANLDARCERIDALMARAYGPGRASVWRQRWRMFFMACAELFGYDGGRQWWVSHYRLERR